MVNNRENLRETTVPITPAILLQLEDELGNLLRAISRLDGELALTPARTDDEVLKRRRLRKRTVTLLEKVSAVAMADFADMIRWIELESRKRADGLTVETLVLMQAPLEVGPFLAEAVWPNQPAALVSATLAVGTDFSYLAGRLGLASTTRSSADRRSTTRIRRSPTSPRTCPTRPGGTSRTRSGRRSC